MKLTDAMLISGQLLLKGHKVPCEDVVDAIRQIVGIEDDVTGGLPVTAAVEYDYFKPEFEREMDCLADFFNSGRTNADD